jgi:hypothetical protein
MFNITERVPDLDEVKAYALKLRKEAEDNATALIILLLVIIAFIGFIQIILSVKRYRELKRIRKICRNNAYDKDCYDCEYAEE